MEAVDEIHGGVVFSVRPEGVRKMALLSCKNAAFGYEGHTAVRNLEFSVETGDYLCVTGENGSGKSTMLQGILGLMPPMEGAVFRNSLKFRDTGYVPQDSAVQKDFPASVSEVVLAGFLGRRGLRPFYSRAEKEAAEANMARLGISDLRKKCYRELSGGQRRRTLLARALCAAVRLLVLDEPAAGLDPPAVFSLYSLLKSLNEKGLTIVMATHNIANLEGSAAHVLHLDKRQIFFGSLKEYRKTAFGERFLLPGEAPHA